MLPQHFAGLVVIVAANRGFQVHLRKQTCMVCFSWAQESIRKTDNKEKFLKVLGKTLGILAAVAVVAAVTTQAHAGTQTIYYPTQDNPAFSITAPDTWKLTPGESEGDYFDLDGPTGAVLSLRTIPGTEDDMKEAIQDSIKFLGENYTDVKIDDPKDHTMNGLKGFYTVGAGKGKADGGPTVFGMAWYALKNGQIGEVWFAASANDKDGADQADKILDTLKAQ